MAPAGVRSLPHPPARHPLDFLSSWPHLARPGLAGGGAGKGGDLALGVPAASLAQREPLGISTSGTEGRAAAGASGLMVQHSLWLLLSVGF